MKKQLLLFLAAILPMMASADASGSCGDNLTWTYIEATHTLTISGEGDMVDYNWNTRPWSSYGEEMIKVIIEDGVTSIGDYAFQDCSGLTFITIPNSVTSIGDYAFEGCYGLTSVTIPNSVTSIGEYAFDGCSGLTSITIPNSVTSIGNLAFQYCSGLTSITIPSSVTSIGSDAFAYCYFSIDNFINNTSLSSSDYNYWGANIIEIDQETEDGVLIKDNTVVFCRSWAKSVTIPNGLTSIGDGAFSSCSGLTSITIPNSVTSIGNYAFACCSGLTSITIPNSLTSIGDYAFQDCI